MPTDLAIQKRTKRITLRRRIKSARIKKGWSQKQLAEYLEIPYPIIRRYEKIPNGVYYKEYHYVLQSWCLIMGY